MIGVAPLPLVDDFLLPYHVGHLIVLLFLLVLPLGVVKMSPKISAINLSMFGVLFMLAPGIDGGVSTLYALFGLGLLVVGPMIYVTSSR